MIIETPSQEQCDQLFALIPKFFEESRYQGKTLTLENFARVLLYTQTCPTKFKLFLSVDDAQKVNGYFLGRLDEDFWTNESFGCDQSIYVCPEARGSGVFKDLLAAFQQWAKQNGALYTILYHTSGIKMDRAEALFNRLGYTKFGQLFRKET